MSDPRALEDLRRRFDKRLESLNLPDAGDRLRQAMVSPPKLNGVVKAGISRTKMACLEALRRGRTDEDRFGPHSMINRKKQPHFPINDRLPLEYCRKKGVEAFANDFRDASWDQLHCMEVDGVAPEFFVDLSAKMRLEPTNATAKRLLIASQGCIESSETYRGADGSGRLAIAFLRLINRLIDCVDRSDADAGDFDPWTWLGAWVSRPLWSLSETAIVDHMHLMIGYEIADAALDELIDLG